MIMKREIVEAVNLCRHEILNCGIKSDAGRIACCVRRHLIPYRENGHVQALLANMEIPTLDSGNLLELTWSDDDEFIIGFFDVPYNPSAFFEAAMVEAIAIPPNVREIVEVSHALPVRVNCYTEGLHNLLCVAVFAENYIGADLKPHYKAYYLVDKFVNRFNLYTRPAIETGWAASAFPDLLSADHELLTQASAIWVDLHEHYHRTGYLPIPQHLKAKSSRNGAGAEELRVDILSILALLKLRSSDPLLRISIQYILAERLIRYPLQAPPQDNYDARSSVALFNYLLRHGVISDTSGRFCFNGGYAHLEQALESISTKIAAREYQLSRGPDNLHKKELALLLPELAQNGDQWSQQCQVY